MRSIVITAARGDEGRRFPPPSWGIPCSIRTEEALRIVRGSLYSCYRLFAFRCDRPVRTPGADSKIIHKKGLRDLCERIGIRHGTLLLRDAPLT
jgi:hypothetical protein